MSGRQLLLTPGETDADLEVVDAELVAGAAPIASPSALSSLPAALCPALEAHNLCKCPAR